MQQPEITVLQVLRQVAVVAVVVLKADQALRAGPVVQAKLK